MMMDLSALECSICCEILDKVVEGPCCHTCFCAACIESWLQRNATCPGCRKALQVADLTPNLPLQRMVDAIPTECSNRERGCVSLVPRGNLTEHLRLCECQLVECPLYTRFVATNATSTSTSTDQHHDDDAGDSSGAGATCSALTNSLRATTLPTCALVLRRELPQHVEQCPYREVQCPNQCRADDAAAADGADDTTSNEPIVACLLDAHLATHCPRAQLACEQCLAPIERRHIEAHLRTECPEFEVECPCAATCHCTVAHLRRKHVASHLQEHAVEHVASLLDVVRERDTTIAQLEQRLDAMTQLVVELRLGIQNLSALKPDLPYASMRDLPVLLPSSLQMPPNAEYTTLVDSRTVLYTVPFFKLLQRTPNNTAPELVLADRPVPNVDATYFFEVRIEHPGSTGVVGIGLSVCLAHLAIMPGWINRSYGYHGDDGKKFGARFVGTGTAYGPTFGKGDTVGCGYNPLAGTIFFTKNASMLGVAFDNVHEEIPLFPCVGLHSPDCRVVVNFGQQPFVFPIARYASANASLDIDERITAATSPLSTRPSAGSAGSSPVASPSPAASSLPSRSTLPHSSPVSNARARSSSAISAAATSTTTSTTTSPVAVPPPTAVPPSL